MKMLVLAVVTVILIVIGMATYVLLFSQDKQATDSSKANADLLFIYQGKTVKLDPSSALFEPIQKEAERMFQAADTTYKLSVSNSLIERQKREGALEVIYVKPKNMTVKFNGKTPAISRLLVPLNGRFASGREVALFYGDPDYGAFNILATPVGLDQIRELVSKLK